MSTHTTLGATGRTTARRLLSRNAALMLPAVGSSIAREQGVDCDPLLWEAVATAQAALDRVCFFAWRYARAFAASCLQLLDVVLCRSVDMHYVQVCRYSESAHGAELVARHLTKPKVG